MKKLVFITPYFGRTGSEIALFNLITRIRENDVTIVSYVRGALAAELPDNIKFADFESYKRSLASTSLTRRLVNKFLGRKPFEFESFLDAVIDQPANSLFYVNTIAIPQATNFLIQRGLPYVLHVHELPPMYIHLAAADMSRMIHHAEHVFCSSHTAMRGIETLGRHDRISIAYPAIDTQGIEKIFSGVPENSSVIGQDAFVIAMAGTLDPNKNPERFLRIGMALKDRGYPVHLLWLGVDEENAYFNYIKQRAANLGLQDSCRWVGRLTDSKEYLHLLGQADCFVLTSNYESFSIVLVEALALGKPVFSFRSGGPEEIINSESIGRLVANYDEDRMVLQIEQLIQGRMNFDHQVAKSRASDFSIENAFAPWITTLAPLRRN